MGVRAVVRDLVGIYLGYELVKGALFKSFSLTLPLLIAAAILLILSVWFLLERLGLL